MKERPLTAKQQRFCEEYQIDLNATQAAIRAGYCANAVHRSHLCNVIGSCNLAKVGIKAEIKRLKAITSEKTGITVKWVVDNLREVAIRCMNAVPVNDDDDAEWQFDAGGANRALQLLGMHVDAFNADNKSKAVDARTFNLTQIRAILDADKAKCKEIEGITGGIAGESIVGHTGGL